jgi:[acyl-carrier-protein] S-malonyltransferase
MFALTGDALQAEDLFAQARGLLAGRDPRDLVISGEPDALHHDRIGQILCTLQSLAAAATLACDRYDIVVTGYSVGELAAWGVAGGFSPHDTLDLAASRAEAMDRESRPGDGLLFVRGLSHEVVSGLCEQHGGAIAIINPDNAYILGGGRAALRGIAADARALNAMRVIAVPVEVASHTPKLARASTAFRENLDQSAPAGPFPLPARLLSGIDGAPVLSCAAGLDKLAAQISQTVHWADCLQGCVEAGASAFLELGPGSALSRMAADAYPSIPSRALDDFRSVAGARAWIAGQCSQDGS